MPYAVGAGVGIMELWMRSLKKLCGVTGLLLTLALPARAQQGEYDWSTSRELHGGIAHARAEITFDNALGLACPHYDGFSPGKPRKLRLSVLKVDTQHPALRLTATGRADGWGRTMPDYGGRTNAQYVIRTRRQTTADFVRQSQETSRPVLAAVNAAPWSPFESRVDFPYADGLGLTISGGLLISPANGRPSLVIYKDGRPDMLHTDRATDLSGMELAVTGFGFCLVNGEPIAPDRTLHPRTGYGLCADRRFLFLLVIDGRQAASQGATVHEVGKWLRHYGAHTGINMDGGGSTTMAWWNDENGAVELLNRPPWGERKVGCNLGVYRDRSTGGE